MISTIRTKGLVLMMGLFALGASLIGCKDNDDSYTSPEMKLSVNEINLPIEGSAKTLEFETNRKWTITGVPAWININPTSGGSGKHTITVKALENGGAMREALVNLSFGSKLANFKVIQVGSSNPGTQPIVGMPLADFIKKYDTGKDEIVSEDVTFQATVLTNTPANNVTGKKNITVQSGSAGINVRLAADNTFAPGALLTFKAKGAKVTRFNGSLQIDYTGITNGIEDTRETRLIEPLKVTLADIYKGKYENILVQVDAVQFKTSGGALNARTSGTQYNQITDCVTATPEGIGQLSVAISFYATFKSEVISDKNGSIVAILQKSKTNTSSILNYNLWIRTKDDLKLAGERCTESGTIPSPPPTPPTPAPSGDHPIFTAYIEGSANNKYLQIHNPTTKDIDLTGYSILLEAFTGAGPTDKPGTKSNSLALTGKLEPGKFIVIKNDKATLYTSDAIISNVTYFNGNDNIALMRGETVVDVIGTWGNPWVNGTKGAAIDITLHRKTTITKPNATFTEDEWDRLAKDDVSILGKR